MAERVEPPQRFATPPGPRPGGGQAGRYTVGELAEDYLEHARRLGRKDSTIYGYRRRVETHVLPAFGSHAIDSVTPDEVPGWR